MRAFRLSLLTLDRRGKLVYRPDALLAVDAKGRIAEARPFPRRLTGAARGARDLRGRLAIPGLIDAHCHLSQYPAVAADGLELLPWLRRHIFPLERNFRGPKARALARHFFTELAAHGTTTAAIYTSIWKDSTEACFEEALASGLRVIMGKVMMDRGSYDERFRGAPSRRAELSLRESEELCRKWHGAGGGRLLYAFTPRFALSCSEGLMRRAGELAAAAGAYIQTHLSENHDEVKAVRRAFPKARSYAEVYERAGLLGPRTILAHSIWLSEAESRLIAKSGAAVAYCPTSNAFLSSGIMNAARMDKGGIPVALGSDVAAGPSLCLFEAMRQAVFNQRLGRAHGLFKGDWSPTPERAFRMATLGGAEALGLEESVGSLEPGKQADFVVLDPSRYHPAGPEPRDPAMVLSRLVYRASRAAVLETYVEGRRVY